MSQRCIGIRSQLDKVIMYGGFVMDHTQMNKHMEFNLSRAGCQYTFKTSQFIRSSLYMIIHSSNHPYTCIAVSLDHVNALAAPIIDELPARVQTALNLVKWWSTTVPVKEPGSLPRCLEKPHSLAHDCLKNGCKWDLSIQVGYGWII